MPGSTIPRGNIAMSMVFSTTLAPAQVAANTCAEQSFAIPGVQIGDYINTNIGAAQTAGIFIANCRVSALNTVQVSFGNCTGGALTPAAGVYGFVVGRPDNLPLPANAT